MITFALGFLTAFAVLLALGWVWWFYRPKEKIRYYDSVRAAIEDILDGLSWLVRSLGLLTSIAVFVLIMAGGAAYVLTRSGCVDPWARAMMSGHEDDSGIEDRTSDGQPWELDMGDQEDPAD